MTRDFLMATIAALGLTACGPDLTTESKPPSNVGAAPPQPAATGQPASNDPTVARAGDTKDAEQKEGGEKTPR